MAWTQPKTWSSEPLTSADLNTHLRDNLEALKDPPSAQYVLDEASDYSTTSTSFVAVDSSNLALSLTTTGGDLLVHFHGVLQITTHVIFLDVYLDGSPIGGDDGLVQLLNGTHTLSFTRLVQNISAGAHTLELRWRVNAGTAVLYAGAGTLNADLHPQFWVREVS